MNIYLLSCSLQPVTTNSVNNASYGVNNERNQGNVPVKKNDLTEKCRVCFMIYPRSMTTPDREKHVNEHLND